MENRAVDRSTGLQRWELWALVVLLLVGAGLRLVALTDVPPGLRYDELLNYRMAGRVLAGERPLYFTESWGHEPLFHYAQAAVIALTGESDWSLRLPGALFGLLSVLTTWLVARRLFGARVAILAAATLTPSFWSVFYSRQGLRAIALAPLSGLTIYFLWRGVGRPPDRKRRAVVDASLGGICLGGTLYTYMAARALPLLLAAFALYLGLFHRSSFKRAWFVLLLLCVVAGLVAAPLLALLYKHPEIEQRTGQLDDVWAAAREGRLGPALSLAVQAWGMFVWRGERDWLYNVYGRPVFDPLTGGCLVLGLVLAMGRWRRARFALLLMWLTTGLLPAMVAPPAASLIHAIAAQPPAYIAVAVGAEALWGAAAKRREWVGYLLIAGLVTFHGVISCRDYFVTWANAPEVWELYQGGVNAVAREMDARDPPGPVAVGAPYVNYWHPWNALAFDLALRREDLDVRWFNPAGGWVWPAGDGPATVYFPTAPLDRQAYDPALRELFVADAALLSAAGDTFTSFRVAHPTALEDRLRAVRDAHVAWPPDRALLPPPALPLVFDDRFALLGYELHRTAVSPGAEVRLITYWEVLAADSTPVVAFVHLTPDGQDIWGQQDWLDVRPAGLQPGDRFAQVHAVPLKPEASPGVYHVQLGFYNPDTSARLPIAAAPGSTADRVWVGAIEVTD